MVQHEYVVAAALVRRNGELLLVLEQGPDDPEPKWALPGGVAEPGELLHEALARVARGDGPGAGPARPASRRRADTHRARSAARRCRRADARNFRNGLHLRDCRVAWRAAGACGRPDGLVSEARFFPIPQAVALLNQLPFRPMREPIVAHLRGEAESGALWLYRSDGGDAATQLMLRAP